MTGPPGLLPEPLFLRALSLERRRAERSEKPFVLMLLTLESPSTSCDKHDDRIWLCQASAGILATIRETDVAGWYHHQAALGLIFTELGPRPKETVEVTLHARVTAALRSHLTPEALHHVRTVFHWFPDARDDTITKPPPIGPLYPDLVERERARRPSSMLKRATDILGSFAGLIILSPLLLAIALAVKLSSPGPVLFRQERVGRYHTPFTFLKFRSMYANNDPRIHIEYIRNFIAATHASTASADTHDTVYKLTADPRVTRVGRLLRKTSLDELPQLLNVLTGTMSLVGPRPPIPYELENYHIWHRRRVLEAKPGMTGLWQVTGRSRLRFDDMVRLDLRYARTRSLWKDVKILVRTPRAVLSRAGAY